MQGLRSRARLERFPAMPALSVAWSWGGGRVSWGLCLCARLSTPDEASREVGGCAGPTGAAVSQAGDTGAGGLDLPRLGAGSSQGEGRVPRSPPALRVAAWTVSPVRLLSASEGHVYAKGK